MEETLHNGFVSSDVEKKKKKKKKKKNEKKREPLGFYKREATNEHDA